MENFMDLLLQPLRDVGMAFFEFVPNLLAMLIIFIAGFLFSWLIKLLILRFFRIINFDSWCDRVGLTAIIRKGDVWSRPSDVFGSIIFWFLIIFSFIIGLSALRLQTIDNLIEQFLFYIPRAFSAIVILIAGYIFAGFISRAVLITAVNSGYHYAKILAEAVRLLLIVLILAMALEQLRIAPGIVIAAFSIVFGGIILALAIAFGIGGIDAAKRIINGGEGKPEPKERKNNEKERDAEYL
ncbi:MAG: hypothetical protein IT392_11825 [Nitrospirae bacterium]|nr:hypothetical protein [Nitrospirota bacterium]